MMLEKIKATANYIRENIQIKPKIGIVCGSGLANIVNIIQTEKVLDYSSIPNFAKITPPAKGPKTDPIINADEETGIAFV